MDKIIINGIYCEACLGISDQERAKPQVLVIDATLAMDLEPAANTDDLTLTVDYEQLIRQIQKTVSDHQCCLVEAVAGHICKSILANNRILSVEVTVKKFPEALRDTIDHVAVKMARGDS